MTDVRDAGDPDRIEREVLIAAPSERVWQLVSQPGWWIGDGDPAHRTVTQQGDVVVVDFPPHGRFPVRQVAADAPRYIAYRGAADVDQPLEEGSSTLVEFFLDERDGGTLLRVVESGFSALYPSPDRRAAAIEDNRAGWEMQLGVAKRESEPAAA